MPQKRNPDAAELVRAKVGRIAGAFQGLVLVMKGLPLAYSKDMQEDKEATFDALSALALAPTGADAHGRGHGAERGGHAGGGVGGLLDGHRPRRLARAHAQGPLPRGPLTHGRDREGGRGTRVALEEMPLAALQEIEPKITKDVYSVLTVENSVKSRTSYGGTAPQNVRKMARGWRKRLERDAGAG